MVILVDGYDKPILDNINDVSTPEQIKERLKGIYSVIKAQDPNIRFAFLTGVSKFSKVSIFSGLNNLTDISLSARYSAICGYTQQELEEVFAEHLEGADLPRIQRWYNGYNWLGEAVYNPYDILLFLQEGQTFRPYWFATGTPSFLLETLANKHFYAPDLENIEADYETAKQIPTS